MKAYVMQVLVIDHDEIGPGQAARELEAGRFGNDCIAPQVLGSPEVHDIGEWTDAHPLNQAGTDVARWLRTLEDRRLQAQRDACAHRWEWWGDWGDERCPLCGAVKGPEDEP